MLPGAICYECLCHPIAAAHGFAESHCPVSNFQLAAQENDLTVLQHTVTAVEHPTVTAVEHPTVEETEHFSVPIIKPSCEVRVATSNAIESFYAFCCINCINISLVSLKKTLLAAPLLRLLIFFLLAGHVNCPHTTGQAVGHLLGTPVLVGHLILQGFTFRLKRSQLRLVHLAAGCLASRQHIHSCQRFGQIHL